MLDIFGRLFTLDWRSSRHFSRCYSILLPLALATLLNGCLFRTRKVEPPPTMTAHSATLEELLARLDRFDDLKTLKATVDMQLSVLNNERTKETEYRDVRGFILATRDGEGRIQAQAPVTRQRAFGVYLAWNGRFFEGSTALDKPSPKRAENIRPQHILDPLLPDPPQENEAAVLDAVVEGGKAYYVVQVQRPSQDGVQRIVRKFWFDRTSPEIPLTRLQIYDEQARVVTDATYSDWDDSGPAPYPVRAVVSRPRDGYALAVTFVKPGVNESIPEESFVLEPPEGVKVEQVGVSSEAEQGKSRDARAAFR